MVLVPNTSSRDVLQTSKSLLPSNHVLPLPLNILHTLETLLSMTLVCC